jgi:hypothetical protein
MNKPKVPPPVVAALRPWNDVIERRRELFLDALIRFALHREAMTADGTEATLP